MAPVTLASLGTQNPLFPDTVINSLSTTSAAALRIKTFADQVKSGTLVGGSTTSQDTNIKNVNNRVGPISLMTALWWYRTSDATYLAPLKTFILASPKPVDATQALNEFRAIGGMLLAVDLLKRKGQWDDTALLPNHNNITWAQYVNGDGGSLLPLTTRVLQTSGGRWSRLMVPTTGFTGNANEGTADDSASNWGGVARFAIMAWAILNGDQALFDKYVLRFQKFLGETGTGLADFTSSSTYLASWNNWLTTANGSGVAIPAGIGKRDAPNPGLDGVVLNDIDRGNTGYNPTGTYFGASTSGLTYPLENAEYVEAVAALLIHMGYPVLTWGDSAITRMHDRFNVIGPADTLSMYGYVETQSGIYKNHRWMATQISQKSYGTATAVASSVQSMPRSIPNFDWLAPADASSDFGQFSLVAAGTTKSVVVTDALGVTDSSSTVSSKNVTITDSMSMLDPTNTQADVILAVVITDTLDISETRSVVSTGVVNLSITDSIGLVDSRVVVSDVVRNLTISDTLGLIDSRVVASDIVINLLISDLLGINEVRALSIIGPPPPQGPPPVSSGAYYSIIDIYNQLVAAGYTTGTIMDRERARLLAITGANSVGTTLQDLYAMAGERPRL